MGEKLNKWTIDNLNSNGWSMSELARRGELNQSYVSSVLSGKSQPGSKFYVGISKAFEIPLDQIERLDREGIAPGQQVPDSELAQLIGQLPDEEKQYLYEFAQWRLKVVKERKQDYTPPKPLE